MEPAETPFTRNTFTELAERYHRALHAFVVGLVQDPDLARDVVQEVFVDAWRAAQRDLPPFLSAQNDSDRRRWLFRVAYRHAIDLLRHRHILHWQSLDDDDFDGTALTTPPFEDRVIEHELLRTALARLSAADIACLLLLVVHGFTPGEAAEIINSTPQAIARRLPRARRRLLAAYLALNLPLSPSSQEASS